MKIVSAVVTFIIINTLPVSGQQWITTGSNISSSNTGNVGIGTTNPNSAQLQVAKSTGGTIAITTNEANGSAANPLTPNLSFLGYLNGIKASIRALEQSYNYYGSSLIFSVKSNGDATTMTDVMTLKHDGNVGIGTSSPGEKLDIKDGNIRFTANKTDLGSFGQLQFFNGQGYSTTPRAFIEGRRSSSNDNGYLDLATSSGSNVPPSVRMTIDPTGNVGIGTTSPSSAQLQVANSTGGTIAITTNGNSGTDGSPLAPSLDFLGYLDGPKARIRALERTYNGYGSSMILSVKSNVDATTMTDVMTLQHDGNIGIGTFSPIAKMDVRGGNIYTDSKILIGTSALNSGTHSLAVNGSAIFTKAVVKLTSAWPDYVFKPLYKFPSLNELESFLLKNQHLPDVPTAADIEKNGIDLGDNQTMLLKKIEELTLYMIDLNKKVEALAKENELLNKKINSNNK